MGLWPFGRKSRQPPGGLTINKNFYLSVLCVDTTLPPLLQLINPQGSNGALMGFGAPLAEGASKDILNEPLPRGGYVLTSPNKLTIVQMDIFGIRDKEVPTFQPPTDPLALQAAGLSPEKLERARSAQWLANLLIRGYEPELYPTVQFMLAAAARLAELTGGTISDPLAELYRSPQELQVHPRLDPRIDFREIGSVKAVRQADGVWVSTRGLVKFNLPELELYGLTDDLADKGANMLISAGQQALIGIPLRVGETAFAKSSPLQVVEGTRNLREWVDRPTLELRDPGGSGALAGVTAWQP